MGGLRRLRRDLRRSVRAAHSTATPPSSTSCSGDPGRPRPSAPFTRARQGHRALLRGRRAWSHLARTHRPGHRPERSTCLSRRRPRQALAYGLIAGNDRDGYELRPTTFASSAWRSSSAPSRPAYAASTSTAGERADYWAKLEQLRRERPWIRRPRRRRDRSRGRGDPRPDVPDSLEEPPQRGSELTTTCTTRTRHYLHCMH